MPGSGFQLAPNEILNSFIEGTRQREHREQLAKENQYKKDMLDLHHQEVDASTKHLNLLSQVAAQNLKDQIADRIQSGKIPGAIAQGLPTGSPAQPQTPGQIPIQSGTLPGGIQRPAMPGTQSPTQDLGPAQQVPIGYTDPSTGVTLNPGEYQTPQASLAAEANRMRVMGAIKSNEAGATTEAEEKAKLPYKLKDLEAMQEFQREKDIRDRASMERVSAGNNNAHIKGMQIQANAHLQGIQLLNGMGQDSLDEINRRVAAGEPLEDVAKTLKLKTPQIQAWEKANHGTITPLNKSQAQTLNSVGTLFAQDGPVDKMESFAKHYSADTQLGATVNKLLLKPTSTWSAHEAAIMSEYESMQAEFVKAGRVTMGDENLRSSQLFKEQGKELFPDVKYNTAENIKRAKRFESESVGILKNKLVGIPKDDLQRYTSQRNIPLDTARVSDVSGKDSGKMSVIRRSDHVAGTIDAKDYDPAKYERR